MPKDLENEKIKIFSEINFNNLGREYLGSYGIDLESNYDKYDGSHHAIRLFCLDCSDYPKRCKGGKEWEGCLYRKSAVRLIQLVLDLNRRRTNR